ncbi:hypothetical protein GGP41_008309 [Bipolaris sorokiniana]|uniref:DUF8035 domain-containing protein n=2 Tax=Cochliobolus sativus TaxID=45130 RepID=A0A8H5ZLK4_COCSA|nr:uncharacterized protein COCSADRAFT_241350 [Bipolaris sorokiniana ND90Pr]EMD60315.1 hypothetical protein COCSADRAFT_241350 [Bipolaris sorokiniana ND90Pr]KAF5852893.1 hypothetical protein GGP41_008309 [Bipolaris sorokiniana]
MSRRYPTAELYEERERDFYRNGNRSDRNYDELDFELRRSGVGGDPRRSMPDFLREDYNRPTAGPLVMRGRDDDSFSRSGPRSARGFDDDVRSTRSRPPPPASSVREVERDDITIRRREQSRGPPERDDIVFRRGDGPPVRSVSRPAPRQVDDDEVRFRGRTNDDIDIRASRSEISRHGRDVSAERGSIRFQEKDGNFEIRANRREFSRDGRDTSRERSSLTIRGRERSLPPPARNRGELVAREREEFVIRRPRAESPPQNNREVIRDEIIIRRKEERAPTPSPSPSPPPPPPPPAPEPEIRPPIIQEIITHHRHIDHGVVRARSPTPPPPPAPPSPPPPLNETLEIEINRRESHSRGRGRSAFEELDIDINLNHQHGAVKQRKKDMWTEITKDLVIREAIDSMGYACEETDDFFYVMEYLRYEDVLHLVEISDEIRRKRKSRIREIEIERKSIHNSRPTSGYDERYYETDLHFDSRRSRYH